jgi:hypothetical protein
VDGRNGSHLPLHDLSRDKDVLGLVCGATWVTGWEGDGDGPLFDRLSGYGRWDEEQFDLILPVGIVCDEVSPEDHWAHSRVLELQGHLARGLIRFSRLDHLRAYSLHSLRRSTRSERSRGFSASPAKKSSRRY